MEALESPLRVYTGQPPSPGAIGVLGQPKRTVSPKRTTSPPSPRAALRSRGPTTESVASSRLFRDISPTKAFAQAGPDLTRVSLPELFKQKDGLQSLRPHYSIDTSPKHEEPQSNPRLLQRLEGLLQEKLKVVDKVGGSNTGFAAAQIRLDAHRQVFDAFLHSFTTYRSLLMRIKGAYDTSLDDAMAAVFDNMHMHADLGMADPKMDAAIRAAKQQALQDASSSRKEIQDEVEQQEAIAAEAERRCQQADGEMNAIRSNIASLQREKEQLTQQVAEVKRALLAASSWSTPELLARFDEVAAAAAKAPQE